MLGGGSSSGDSTRRVWCCERSKHLMESIMCSLVCMSIAISEGRSVDKGFGGTDGVLAAVGPVP